MNILYNISNKKLLLFPIANKAVKYSPGWQLLLDNLTISTLSIESING